MKWTVKWEWAKDYHQIYHIIDPEVVEPDGSGFTVCGVLIRYPVKVDEPPDGAERCVLCIGDTQ